MKRITNEVAVSKVDNLEADIERILRTERKLGRNSNDEWTVEYKVSDAWVESLVATECLMGLLTFAENCYAHPEEITFESFMKIANNDPVLSIYLKGLRASGESYLAVEAAIRRIFEPETESDEQQEIDTYCDRPSQKDIRRFAGVALAGLIIVGGIMVTGGRSNNDPYIDKTALPSEPRIILPSSTNLEPQPATTESIPETTTLPTTSIPDTTSTSLPAETLPPETTPVTTVTVPIETTLPPAPETTQAVVETIYLVQTGDTFNQIAVRYNIDPAILASWNTQIADFTKIYSGQPIIIHESAAGSLGVAAPVEIAQPKPVDDGVYSHEVCRTKLHGTPYSAKPGESLFEILSARYGSVGASAALDADLRREYRLDVIYANPEKLPQFDECIPPEQEIIAAANRQG